MTPENQHIPPSNNLPSHISTVDQKIFEEYARTHPINPMELRGGLIERTVNWTADMWRYNKKIFVPAATGLVLLLAVTPVLLLSNQKSKAPESKNPDESTQVAYYAEDENANDDTSQPDDTEADDAAIPSPSDSLPGNSATIFDQRPASQPSQDSEEAPEEQASEEVPPEEVVTQPPKDPGYYDDVDPVQNIVLRAASFNIHTSGRTNDGLERLRKSYAFARSYKMDIIAIQETSFAPQFNAAVSDKSFGRTYDFYPNRFIRQDNGNMSGRPIAYDRSKFKLISGDKVSYMANQPAKSIDAPVALLQHRKTGKKFYVIGMHNPAGRTDLARKQRMEAGAKLRGKIIELKRTGLPVILLGDFNETSTRYAYRDVRSNLVYCILTTGNVINYAPDALNKRGGACPSRQGGIDRAYTTPNITVLMARSVQAGAAAGTDHPYVALAKVSFSSR